MSITPTDDWQQVENHCVEWARENPSLVIGIDGARGVGKTTRGNELKDKLKDKLSAEVLHLDKFHDRNRAGATSHYVDGLDVEKLRAEVQAKRNSSRPLVIEGICLWQAVEKIPLSPDFVIYIKRITQEGSWDDKDICDPLDYKSTLANLEGDIKNYEDTAGPKLDKQIAQYHHEFTPLERATVIFHHIP